MAEFDEIDVIRASELSADPVMADLKMLEGGMKKLCDAQTDLQAKIDARVASLDAKMDAKFDTLQRTISQLSTQLGKRPIEQETSRHTPPVSHFSDPSVRDDLNRLPLDNRKSLLRKIDMPKFDGTNAYDWLSKVERFFRIGRYSDYDKLDLIALSLEGDVLKWYNWEVIRRDFVSWEEFRRRLFRRFGPAPEKSSEKKPIHQTQVPVSQLEPSLKIPKASPNVCENAQAVVGCEHQRSFQKKIRMDVVNGDVERSQCVRSITKNVSAHQVFDTMCQLNRLKPKHKRKLSLSPQSRMFKFKNKTLLSNWSQMNLHPVIDISNVTNSYSCFSADFGLVRKKRTFQCLRLRTLRLHKQAHMSRFLYPMRRLHDPGGKKDEHSDDNFDTAGDVDNVAEVMNVIGDVKGKVATNPVAFHSNVAAATSISQSMFVCVREFASLLEVNCLWDECMMHTTTVISATLYSLFSCEVDTAENISSGLSPFRQVWEPGGVLSAHVLVDHVAAGSTGLASDGCVILGMHCVGFGSGKTELLATGQQMQQVTMISAMLPAPIRGWDEACDAEIDAWEATGTWIVVHTPVAECNNDRVIAPALDRQAVLEQFMKRVRHALLYNPFQMISRVGILVLWAQRVFQKLAAPLLKVLKSWMFKYKPQLEPTVCTFDEFSRRAFLIQWQGRDVLENSWVYSMAFVQSYHAFKLEDKLVFGEGSIDTIKQSYCRR